jgi:beta-galactosidase
MKRILSALLTLASLPALAQPHHVFSTQGDHFTLDGKPFKVLSGELHYARIPREYWHARLKMARAMGLNTIATYVFWNVHEPTPGHFDFSGNHDLAAFLRAAHEEGLYVILRSGPYSCAEWELGGLPAWLLADPKSAAAIRSNDSAFMVPAERWIKRLAQETTPLQIGRGGPIIMTQIENEYGNYGSDQAYMAHLKQIYESVGFNDSLLFSADNWRNIANGSIPGLFAATNFGIGNHKGGMDALLKIRPDAPLFVSEYWPGWFDAWGRPHETRPIPPQLEDLDYILTRGTGINIYMFHGGTSFGFMSGATGTKTGLLPDVTSYDYDAPLDESGRPTPKYFAYRKLLSKFACSDATDSCLPPVPATTPIITIPSIMFHEYGPLWQNLPAPIASEQPQPMERFGQSYGYILYRTQLPAAVNGDLVLNELHDYAQIYLNGRLVGTLDRRLLQNTLPVTVTGPARLDIIVANDGRINSTRQMRGESMGITTSATLAGQPLTGWHIYPLPMTPVPQMAHLGGEGSAAPTTSPEPPTFRRARFTLSQTGDTFLDISKLGKGALWINGHPIGRFWNIGPQQTLYVPAPWLKKGENEIVVFDLMPPRIAQVTGLNHPILNGPTQNQTRSNQQ